MSTREFLTNVTIILSVMAIGTLLEVMVPLFGGARFPRERRTANLALTAVRAMPDTP